MSSTPPRIRMHKDRFSTWLGWASSGLCLIALVALARFAPAAVAWGGGLPLYLTLLPAFVLPYLHDWKGAAVAFGLGEAAIITAAAFMVRAGYAPEGMWTVNFALILVSIGAGRVTSLLHQSRIEAEERALSDPGTGLPNRRHALIHLKRGFAAAIRGSDLTVVVFDLDHFKQVNDKHGHAMGDEVLDVFADILRERTRDMNLSARLGGEEFVAILEGAGLEGAVTFAEDVRMTMETTPFRFGNVTVSAGIATYEKGMASPDVLLAAADQALYHAKTRGRNQVAVVGAVPSRGKYRPVETKLSPYQGTGRGERLLVVDDDASTRRSVGNALRRAGFEVLEAPAPEHAIRIVRGLGTPPALVVTELISPSMTGFHLVEELAKFGSTPRALYLASYLAEDELWEGAPGVAREFLRKPVSLDEVVKAVRRILDAPVFPEPVLVRGNGFKGPDPTERRPTIHVLASRERMLTGLANSLRDLDHDDVVEVRDGERPDAGPPELVVAWPSDPPEEELEAVEAYLSGWAPDVRPALLLMTSHLPEGAAARWPSLFPSLMLTPGASPDELRTTVRHLLEVQSLRARYHSEQRGMAAQVAARSAELESQNRDLLLRLARAAEMRDDFTGRHAERVGVLAGKLAKEMGLPDETAALISQAAPLHDLGKIATPDAILNKPDALTHIERDLMRRHTELGSELLAGSNHRLLQEAARIARSHHERWDGDGYPDGLRGDDIPISARIVAVADAYDCITNTRSYREAFSPERAVKIIQEDSGSHFDPAVAAALCSLADQGELESDPVAGDVQPAPIEAAS